MKYQKKREISQGQEELTPNAIFKGIIPQVISWLP